jgi:hypothetical protein
MCVMHIFVRLLQAWNKHGCDNPARRGRGALSSDRAQSLVM